jgi:hypothetical protein
MGNSYAYEKILIFMIGNSYGLEKTWIYLKGNSHALEKTTLPYMPECLPLDILIERTCESISHNRDVNLCAMNVIAMEDY